MHDPPQTEEPTPSETLRMTLKRKYPHLSQSFDLVEFNPKTASSALWQAYFTLSEAVLHEFHQRDRLPDQDLVKRLLTNVNPLYQTERLMLLDEDQRAVAAAALSYDTERSPDYDCNLHVCHIRISVIPAFRRRKIATRLLQHTLKTAALLGKDTIMAEADNPIGLKFCKHLQGDPVHEEIQQRLYLEDVDWGMAKAWLRKGNTRSHSIKVEFFQDCPERDIEEFCRVYTEVINQRPVGDMEEALNTTLESRRIEERSLKRKGLEWYTMVSREPDGSISGLTDIIYNPEEPHRVKQYLTGVLSKYRRRGLAKRLKAEMLALIKEKFPDVVYIATSIARTNRPMRSINRQMGFIPQKSSYMVKWELKELERRLNEVLPEGCSW